MRTVAALLPHGRPSWPTLLVLVGSAVVALALTLSALAPLATTLAAVGGCTAFVLGVSASISAFLERDAYADSDFYR